MKTSHRSVLLALVPSILAAVPACTTADDVALDPTEASADGKADGVAFPDVRCTGTPSVTKEAFRHTTSSVITLASPAHRGFDLVASASEQAQHLTGEISYGVVDKALTDEVVDVYACRSGSWKRIGTATTDDAGQFDVSLAGSKRLPQGLRDMYVGVRGDQTGARFLALVAPVGTELVVSDVDGTLTSSENAFPEALVTGAPVAINVHAPSAFDRLHRRGYLPVYVTARGDRFTAATREWLAAAGMPRGPMRLAPHAITLPGEATVAYKSGVFAALEDHGMEIAVGIGNRASDITAYSSVGVDASGIWIKLPEFTDELSAPLGAKKAHGFADYADLSANIDALPLANH